MDGIKNQHPHLTVTAGNDGDLLIECRCGASDWLSKLLRKGIVADRGKLLHRVACKTKAQYQPEGYSAPTSTRDDDLRRFAGQVRKYGLTKGRDTDVLEAVRKGYLSETDAMNADD